MIFRIICAVLGGVKFSVVQVDSSRDICIYGRDVTTLPTTFGAMAVACDDPIIVGRASKINRICGASPH
jgi:lysophospholipid acyltransferase (LPLAT)-like uncharacterized protein